MTADGGTRLLLTVREAADMMAVSRSKLYELIGSGAVRSIRIGGLRRVPVEAVESYIAARMNEGAA